MNSSPPTSPIFAIYNFYKPKGISSYDLLRHIKRKNLIPKEEKFGHIGTLDVFASGVLLVSRGTATRLNDYVHELLPKTYVATGILGQSTSTGDPEGEVSSTDYSQYLTQTIFNFDKNFIQKIWSEKFSGEYWQVPHKYSATKFQGKKLYEWARAGVHIPKPPVKRYIYHLEILDYSPPEITFRATVSSGTYIRKLFEELAQELGTVGHLKDLCREGLGNISMQNAFPLYEANEEDSLPAPLSWDEVIPIEKLTFTFEESLALLNGREIILRDPISVKTIGYKFEDLFLGILEYNEKEIAVKSKVNLTSAVYFQEHYGPQSLAASKNAKTTPHR
ncbi:MAG: tRNA pseudouridine(55) synthase TruB [Bacteriovoracaceae bacterium]|nr:tRNA pseudouridine(55) synthase TruB [Bacteriovoracaceae bacterium]